MIDERAIIHPTVEIGQDVIIGPWAFIGENTTIGDGTEISTHVVIGRNTTLGQKNKIYSHASIGSDPQHLAYTAEEETWVEIGSNNVIREFVTINRGTKEGYRVTRIGNNNYLMAYSHIAHDCKVGSHVIFANTASIAGHVEVGDYANLGAFSGVHQFCRIGSYCFLGRATKIYQDILPYMLVTGNPGVPTGLNTVGLRRHGFNTEIMRSLKRAFQLIYRDNLKLDEVCIELEKLATDVPEVNNLLVMINTSTRGFARHNNEFNRGTDWA
ncbi:acyl-ACP--UDP-N-acetylglucosamine O-acyltransferase [Coxiella endosymbiont of Amblyomma nuttalli]|uniref:acyl-ACP--UDP-N-acetylglucosamine O-acyltransferase n=1 Tax=Coxiella endosymbiont of Amblyomma nuttalli TaxID=2749996 RepID=UPI001BA5A43D|nr:acyl-ACP--UDP-N-acetylglucosamine O-acyltransferase [Coxiella endosymbiont of Amblyomma nuttalli]QTS83713.1 Acyl-[acyl-carrier-protein]--UDP-N-acetylglucosamine O-acyltransferase [Coxiella endosymbiont of Amblyomma nuttalli]